MLAYVIDAWDEATGDGPAARPIVVYSPATEEVTQAFVDRADFALQAEPKGTGDAIRAALGSVPEDADEILVLSGDVPLLQSHMLATLFEQRRQDNAAVALLSVYAVDPSGLGRVVRGDFGTVERIVEEKDATPDDLANNEINAGLYVFDAAWLRRRIGSLTPSPATGELYLTDLIRLAREDGRLVSAIGTEDDGRLLGINDRTQLAAGRVAASGRAQRAPHAGRGHDDRPVDRLPRPCRETGERRPPRTERHHPRPDDDRGGHRDRRRQPDPRLDDRAGLPGDRRAWSSHPRSRTRSRSGPFAHVRPGSSIGRGAEVGNFAELKNTRLEAGVKQHHVSYLGDAHLGARTNVGAGTITANYDGRRKNRTTVGEGAFLGVDTMLVAPVDVGDGARTGAGAVVTRDVPAGKLAVGVPARIREPRPPRDRRRAGRAGRARARGTDAMSGTLVELLVIVVLVALNAVFVAAEIALVTIRRTKVDQLVDEGRRGARRVKRLSTDPSRFLAVIQIGVTFVGFLASAFAGVEPCRAARRDSSGYRAAE